MQNRREFIKGAAIVGAMSAVSVSANAAGTKAATSKRGLNLPEGEIFSGMNGAFSPIYTPFTADDRVNEAMIEKVVDFQLNCGLKGFFVTGSTGEGMMLSMEERKTVLKRVAEAAKGRKAKLIAHVGAIATRDSIELARFAAANGYHWISSTAPVYYGQNFAAACEHYRLIATATDLPFMVYSVGKAIDPDRDRGFFDIPNVKGMKYTGYQYWTLKALRQGLDKPIACFAGADEQALSGLVSGEFAGCIGTTDNMIPAHWSKMCALVDEGKFLEAQPLQDDVVRLIKVLVPYDNETYWKSVMRYIGLDCGSSRAPNGKPLTAAEYAELCGKLDKLEFIKRA